MKVHGRRLYVIGIGSAYAGDFSPSLLHFSLPQSRSLIAILSHLTPGLHKNLTHPLLSREFPAIHLFPLLRSLHILIIYNIPLEYPRITWYVLTARFLACRWLQCHHGCIAIEHTQSHLTRHNTVTGSQTVTFSNPYPFSIKLQQVILNNIEWSVPIQL